MATKTRFVGVRLEPAQQAKLLELAALAGAEGNMSVGFRLAIDSVIDTSSVIIERVRLVAKQPDKQGAVHG